MALRILQLTKKVPIPPLDGEAVAVLSMSKAYSSLGHSVDLLSFNTKKHFVDPASIDSNSHCYNNISTVYLDASVSLFDAVKCLFAQKSYNIERFISTSFEQALIQLLKENTYDIIQLESLYMGPYIKTIREHCQAKVVMRSHNIESEIWSDLSRESKSLIKKKYFNHCSRLLSEYEYKLLKDYDVLLTISDLDYNYYKNINSQLRIINIPVGLDMDEYSNSVLTEREYLKYGYLGSLDWLPNIEALKWLLDNVVGKFTENNPFEFHIAGRNPGEWIERYALEANIVIHGEVADAKCFIQDLDVMLVPLFSGSGIRVKILEAMAMGKVVVSTSKGFESIGVTHMENALIAESEEDFIQMILFLNENPNMAISIGKNAEKHIRDNFDRNTLAQKALTFINN